MKNLYDVLGVKPTSTEDQIKQAYRKLAQEHHPDKGGDADFFQELNNAYSVLGDPKKRLDYDKSRSREVLTDIRSVATSVVTEYFNTIER
jgi:curved DNA-binding protein CbpA